MCSSTSPRQHASASDADKPAPLLEDQDHYHQHQSPASGMDGPTLLVATPNEKPVDELHAIPLVPVPGPGPATPVAAPAAAKKGANKILFLNGLRGLAAALVVVQHGGYMGGVLVGAVGVDIFFVLSAFLLTMLFEKKCQGLVAEGASLRKWACVLADYFSRRFFRVYPLFAAVAILLWCLSPKGRQQFYVFNKPEEYDILKVLVFEFESRYHVFWTLPIEIMYYFIIPPFVALTIVLRRFWWVMFVPLTVYVFHDGMYVPHWDHRPLSMHITTFIAGSMGAIIFAKADRAIRKWQFQFTRWSAWPLRAVQYFALAVMMSLVYDGLFFDWVAAYPLPTSGGPPFVSVLVTTIIVIEMIVPSDFGKALEWNFLMFSGKISYSMYLLHTFVLNSPAGRQQKYFNRLFSIFVLVYLLSTVSYYLIEYPMQKLATRVGKWFMSQAVPAPKPSSDAETPEHHLEMGSLHEVRLSTVINRSSRANSKMELSSPIINRDHRVSSKMEMK